MEATDTKPVDRAALEAAHASAANGAGTPAASPTPNDADRRRDAIAHAVLDIVRKTLPDRQVFDISFAGDPVEAGDRPVASPSSRVVVAGPDGLVRLLMPPGRDAFADAYLRGDIDVEGDVITAIEAAETLDVRALAPSDVRRLVRWLPELHRATPAASRLSRTSDRALRGRRHSRARDMAAVRFHYDVGESFYSLWLDRRLTYSCAYFPDGTSASDAPDLLDVAQDAKLDLIARKLRLGPGMRLLDIGCGWGSLIGFAAERHRATTVGVSLSQRQVDEATARAAAAGLADRVTAEVRDYRDLGPLGPFDAVASVGMFEHVGRAGLPTYFRAAYDALEPGGLFLNHGIAGSGPRRRPSALRPRGSRFVQRYVFPDGELVAIEDAIAYARVAGFELLDVQSLRPHYALTLAAWVARLEASWDAAVAAAGREVARTWRLYMSAARMGFERGDLDVFQVLLAKPVDGRPAGLPMRPWW